MKPSGVPSQLPFTGPLPPSLGAMLTTWQGPTTAAGLARDSLSVVEHGCCRISSTPDVAVVLRHRLPSQGGGSGRDSMGGSGEGGGLGSGGAGEGGGLSTGGGYVGGGLGLGGAGEGCGGLGLGWGGGGEGDGGGGLGLRGEGGGGLGLGLRGEGGGGIQHRGCPSLQQSTSAGERSCR